MVVAKTAVAIALSPDQAQAVIQTGAGPLHLYQLRPLGLLGPTCPGAKGLLLGWLPSGALLLTEGAQFVARDLTGRVLRHWKAHAKAIEHAAVSPDGGTAVTLCGNGVALWDVGTGKVRYRRTRARERARDSGHRVLAAHPGGSRFFQAWGDWADFQGLREGDPEWASSNPLHTLDSAAFSPDGRWLAGGGAFGNLRLFDPDRSGGGGDERAAHEGAVTCVVWASPSLVLTASGREVRRWRVERGFPRPLGSGQAPWPVLALAATHEGRALAAGAQGALAWVTTR